MQSRASVAGVDISEVARVELSEPCWQGMLAHAERKLDGRWLCGESREQQAFGLLAGRLTVDAILTTMIFPLLRNVRQDPVRGAPIREAVNELATPSRTPLDQRGWLCGAGEGGQEQGASGPRG